jgi:hypothetical protein
LHLARGPHVELQLEETLVMDLMVELGHLLSAKRILDEAPIGFLLLLWMLGLHKVSETASDVI